MGNKNNNNNKNPENNGPNAPLWADCKGVWNWSNPWWQPHFFQAAKLLTQDYWTQLPWCLWSSRSQELAHFSALLVDGLTLDICWMWKAGIWHYAKDSNFKNIVIPLYNSLFGLQIFFSFNCKQMKGLLVNNMLLIINLTVLYTAWQKDCFLPLCTIKRIKLLFQMWSAYAWWTPFFVTMSLHLFPCYVLHLPTTAPCWAKGKRNRDVHTSVHVLWIRNSDLAYCNEVRRQKVWSQEFRKICDKNENEWIF